MAEFTGIPYAKIIIVAFLPAVIFFLSVYFMVHLQARSRGIEGIPRDQLQNPKDILKRDWYYLLPLALLVYLLVRGFSPGKAAVLCIYASMAVSFIKKETRISIKKIVTALEESTRDILGIGATAGSMGIIIGVVFLTGLGLKFSEMVMTASGGFLFIGIIFVAVAAYVLGMGISISSSYIVLSVIAAPALLKFGLSKMAAHLIVVWYCQSAAITPPVCLAAFAAATIASSDPMKTGFTSLKYAIGMLIIPFLFAYSYVLFNGTLWLNIYSLVAAAIGLLVLSSAIFGYAIRRLPPIFRIILFVSAGLIIFPKVWSGIFGLVLYLLVIISQAVMNRKKTPQN
jgi:TRAP transporter 4TM/12TM fusion protein